MYTTRCGCIIDIDSNANSICTQSNSIFSYLVLYSDAVYVLTNLGNLSWYQCLSHTLLVPVTIAMGITTHIIEGTESNGESLVS